jgi:hypothetical protein
MLRHSIIPLANRYGIGFFVYCGVAAVSALSEWVSFLVALSQMGPNAAAISAFFRHDDQFALSRWIAFRSVRRLRTEVMFIIAMTRSPSRLIFFASSPSTVMRGSTCWPPR